GPPPTRRPGCARRDLSRGAPRGAIPECSSPESSRASGLPPPAHAVARRVQEDAAIEVDDLALHPVGVWRAEPGDGGGDLGGLAEGAERRGALHFLEERPPCLRVAEVESDRVGVDVARIDAVDGDAARAELDREIARERLERRLGGGEDAMAR